MWLGRDIVVAGLSPLGRQTNREEIQKHVYIILYIFKITSVVVEELRRELMRNYLKHHVGGFQKAKKF